KAAQQLNELHQMRHMLERYQTRELLSEAEHFLFAAKQVGGLKVVTATLAQDRDAATLRQMGDFLRDKDATTVAVLSTVKDDKITFLAVCGKEAIAKGIRAGDVIKQVSTLCGGSGGGKPDSAMGGGRDVLKLDDALASVDDFVAAKLK
ncbi:MAG: DHHA1 domain-containing protein, partial [Ruthenibacterium sp.]